MKILQKLTMRFLRAKQQLDQLIPLNNEMHNYLGLHQSNQKIKRAIDFLPVYFAERKIEILEDEIKVLDSEKEQLEHSNSKLEKELESLRSQELETKVLIGQDRAGQRINQIDQEIARLKKQKMSRYPKIRNTLPYVLLWVLLKIQIKSSFNRRCRKQKKLNYQ